MYAPKSSIQFAVLFLNSFSSFLNLLKKKFKMSNSLKVCIFPQGSGADVLQIQPDRQNLIGRDKTASLRIHFLKNANSTTFRCDGQLTLCLFFCISTSTSVFRTLQNILWKQFYHDISVQTAVSKTKRDALCICQLNSWIGPLNFLGVNKRS